ncbi:MAG: hypothetical protein CMJ52_02040 [Planctomycetaceae bacterium]|nr:hypothetical protein [Planctomycetaceae bacterium]
MTNSRGSMRPTRRTATPRRNGLRMYGLGDRAVKRSLAERAPTPIRRVHASAPGVDVPRCGETPRSNGAVSIRGTAGDPAAGTGTTRPRGRGSAADHGPERDFGGHRAKSVILLASRSSKDPMKRPDRSPAKRLTRNVRL